MIELFFVLNKLSD